MSQVARTLRQAQRLGVQVLLALTDGSSLCGQAHSITTRTAWVIDSSGADRIIRLTRIQTAELRPCV